MPKLPSSPLSHLGKEVEGEKYSLLPLWERGVGVRGNYFGQIFNR
jgi:hypothetical protein